MTVNKLKKMLLALLLVTACALLIVACGSDEPATPVGKVVKGPVSGADVYDANGVLVGTTNANGNFPMTGTAPYHTGNVVGSGNLGTYLPILVDGTLGAAQSAPPLQGYGSSSQITPLTTIVATNPALATTFVTLGIDLNADLSTRTTQNTAAFTLLETIGAALSATHSLSPTNYAQVIAAIATSLAAELPATPALFNQMAPGAISTAVITTITANLPALLVAIPTLATDISNAATGAAILPIPGSGSTGSTGGTGGTGGTGSGF